MTISRRHLFSSGMAAGAAAVFPRQLLALPTALADSPLGGDRPHPDSRMEPAVGSPYSAGQQVAIRELARDTMTQLFSGKTLTELQTAGDRLGIPAAKRVNFTVRHAGRLRGSVSADGANLGRQVVASVYHAALDRSYGGPLTQGEVCETRFEVWIQTRSLEVKPDDRLLNGAFLAGVEGLEVELGGRSAYMLPSVAITGTHKTETALLRALCLAAGLEEYAWRLSEVNVRKTQWICLPSVGNASFFSQVSATGGKLSMPLSRSIEESVSYLLRSQDATGRAAYLYDPVIDEFVGKKKNLIRSAGCLFGLSQVLESDHPMARDAGFRACVIKMARGLLDLTTVTNGGLRILQEEESASPSEEQTAPAGAREGEDETQSMPAGTPPIGATALLAAALSGDTLRKEFAESYRQLYSSIVSAQKPDGRFITHFGETHEDERAANFYPGEALLVLAEEAERNNTEALFLCKHAFDAYALQFRSAPTSAFVVWHSNVWSRIAFFTREQVYADFVFEQADWLLKLQLQSHRDPRWIGGFSQFNAAPQVYSIAFTEAIVRALTLAVKVGDRDRTTRYAESVRSGLRFCKQLKIEETQASLLANPSRCRGGIAFGLTDRRVRCDSVQHFITLCLAAEQIKDRVFSEV
jgi:AMMECR1 domain-containing protein